MPNSATFSGANLDVIPLDREMLSSLSLTSRKWIAQEFHDSIAQTLSSITMFINFVDARSPAAGTQVALDKLIVLSQQLRANFAYSRNSEVSLSEQVDAMLEGLETKVNWIAQLPGNELRLTPRLQHELCNIIREGLHNINKHAQATFVFLSISGSDEKVELTLSDNGKGFQHHQLELGGVGLKGISERARSMGGFALIESSLSKGTTIKVEMHSSVTNEVIADELDAVCDQFSANLRHTLDDELLQLDRCIRHIAICPGDKSELQKARLIVARMTDAVREIIYALRGAPASQIALDFVRPQI